MGTVHEKIVSHFSLIFLYNFHREHSLLKLKIKKIIAENQCEKHKTSSLDVPYI